MLLNDETILVGEKCVLVPYRKEHVAKYHEWMQDQALLHATASEPLTLDQEYEMQESWRDDPNKCTFIVLAREAIDGKLLQACLAKETAPGLGLGLGLDADGSAAVNRFVLETLDAMTGDVNLFLSEEETEMDEEANDETSNCESLLNQAEVDIMIAQGEFRRKGLGREATCMMMMYAATAMQLRRFFCKVRDDNEASLQMFKSLGFIQCAYAECFREVELELKRDSIDELRLTTMELLGCHSKLRSFQYRR